MEKEELIKAINSKGLRNSLISIYYNIGRALPFRAQRFPDGRDSDWYRSQFVEVHHVRLGGKEGKYGYAYGFYFRNGERADAFEDDIEGSWCRIDDTKPKTIPCGACGSWILLDILGEPTTEPIKICRLDDKLEFGKHKGKTLRTVIKEDWGWVRWAVDQSEHFFCDLDEVIKEREGNKRVLTAIDVLDFGKYKGKTLQEIHLLDPRYLIWLSHNTQDFIIDFSNFKD